MFLTRIQNAPFNNARKWKKRRVHVQVTKPAELEVEIQNAPSSSIKPSSGSSESSQSSFSSVSSPSEDIENIQYIQEEIIEASSAPLRSRFNTGESLLSFLSLKSKLARYATGHSESDSREHSDESTLNQVLDGESNVSDNTLYFSDLGSNENSIMNRSISSRRIQRQQEKLSHSSSQSSYDIVTHPSEGDEASLVTSFSRSSWISNGSFLSHHSHSPRMRNYTMETDLSWLEESTPGSDESHQC